MESDKITVKIKTIKNEIYELTVNKTINITDFKTDIEKVSGIEKSLIRIVYKGKQLKDDTTLDQYITKDGETVHLIKGIPKPPADSQPPQSNTTNAQSQPQVNPQNPPQPNVQVHTAQVP